MFGGLKFLMALVTILFLISTDVLPQVSNGCLSADEKKRALALNEQYKNQIQNLASQYRGLVEELLIDQKNLADCQKNSLGVLGFLGIDQCNSEKSALSMTTDGLNMTSQAISEIQTAWRISLTKFANCK